MSGKLLLIYIFNFHVLSHLLLIYICKLHWIGYKQGVTVGVGWCSNEMNANPSLDDFIEQDVSIDPYLPLTDNYFDFVVIPAMFQLLQRPRELFEEINRVLKPGGRVFVGKSLLIYVCNFHVLNHFLLIYICKLHWNCTQGPSSLCGASSGGSRDDTTQRLRM